MANNGSTKELHIEAALAKLTAVYNCVNYTTPDGIHPFHLPRNVVTRLQKNIDDLLAHYSWLANNALEAIKYQWLVVPKHHYMWHIGKEAVHLSPRMSWCYSNEVFSLFVFMLFHLYNFICMIHNI